MSAQSVDSGSATKVDDPILFIQEEANKWSQSHIKDQYLAYGITANHEWDNGTLQIPIADPDTTSGNVNSEIVRVASTFGTKVIQWEVTRIGAIPELPNPFINDKNLVLKNYKIITQSPMLHTDGITHTYKIFGIYEYYMLKPPKPSSDIQMSAPPFDTTTLGENTLSDNNFFENIIGLRVEPESDLQPISEPPPEPPPPPAKKKSPGHLFN